MRAGVPAGQPCRMTSTDPGFTAPPPPPPAPPDVPHRVLRRSRTDRIGAGVAGGLGQYFGVDPVLFRVLFAVSAFFGGAGLLAYVVAWAAIPEEGTERAAVDGWIRQMRRRRAPVWLVAVAAGLLLWGVAFSWWVPGPAFPVLVAVIILVVVFGWRSQHDGETDGPPATEPVDLTKPATVGTPAPLPPPSGAPGWAGEARAWVGEARQASRRRRRRAQPIRIAAIVVLVSALITLGIIDAIAGIRIPAYLWVTGGIVTLALLSGAALRRTPWSLASLLVPVIVLLVAFGNTPSSLHDGVGQQEWAPSTASELRTDYRLAFGQGVLDLRQIDPLTVARDVDVTMAAGQVKLILPKDLNATVRVDVRMGNLEVDHDRFNGGPGWQANGFSFNRTIVPLGAATGAPLTIDVHLADGNVTVERR